MAVALVSQAAEVGSAAEEAEAFVEVAAVVDDGKNFRV